MWLINQIPRYCSGCLRRIASAASGRLAMTGRCHREEGEARRGDLAPCIRSGRLRRIASALRASQRQLSTSSRAQRRDQIPRHCSGRLRRIASAASGRVAMTLAREAKRETGKEVDLVTFSWLAFELLEVLATSDAEIECQLLGLAPQVTDLDQLFVVAILWRD